MKACSGSFRWRPMVGVLAVGVFAFSLTLQGEPRGKKAPQSVKSGQAMPGKVHFDRGEGQIKLGPGVPVNLPVLPPRVVDWRTDPTTRGAVVGRPMMPMGRVRDLARAAGGVAAPGDPCIYDAECDDCDLCTVDDCTDDGVCQGGVRHGFPCNDEEDCQGVCVIGLCDAGTPNEGLPCDEDADCGNKPPVEGDCVLGAQEQNGEHCFSDLDCCGEVGGPHGTCDFRFTCVPLASQQCVNSPIPDKCDGGDRHQLSCECPGGGSCTGNSNTTCVGGDRAGERCDCPGTPTPGTCGPGYERDAECDDGLECNGYETCDANACIAGDPLCDPLSETPICDEVNNACVEPCTRDQDCEDGYFCTVNVCDVDGSVTETVGECYEGDPPCGPGGGCTEPAPPSQEPICERGRCCDDEGFCRQFQPPDGPYGEYYANCQNPGDSWLATEYPCQQFPATGQRNGCPTYASGIAPQGDLLVGVDVLWPGNAACPQDAVTRVGDDYTAELAATTDYIAVTIVRFVVSVQIQARPAVEFWDVSSVVPQLWFAVDEQAAPLAYPATPIFIEDTYFDGDVGKMDYAIHTLLFDPA
ncbi:MAG: hypothetical protein JSU86_04360, partial [Phycisphaerales bacterium]